MDNPNPIKYSDLITPDNSITDLIAQLDALIAKYESAKSKIQGAAADAAKSMQNLSGATNEQRQAIALSTEASEKLLAKYRAVDDELMQTKRAQAEVNAINREYTQIAKLVTELNAAKEGSYKKLSAQYRLNKIALNEMSEAERKGTEFGRKLEAESKAIYERMNELQKATGKAQLQVGQYERALGSAIGVNQNFVRVLTDTGEAQRTFNGILAAIKSPVGIAIGVIGGLTAAYKLFKSSIHETQQTGDAFDLEMAGWRNTWSLFQKSVATFDFSVFINGAKAAYQAGKDLQRTLDELFEIQNSIRIQRAKMSEELSNWEETMRDSGKPLEERLTAAENYKNAIIPIYKQEQEAAKKLRDDELKNLFATTNARRRLTDEEKQEGAERLANFIETYNLQKDTIDAAREYNKALQTIAKVERGEFMPKEYLQDAKKIRDNATEAVKGLADIVKQYDLTNDAAVQAYVDAEEKYLKSSSALYQENKRIINLQNSLNAEAAKKAEQNSESRAKAAEDAAKAEAKAAKEAEDARAKEAAQAIINQRNILNAALQSIQLQISVTENGTEEMLALRLAMVEKQRDIEIFENKQKVEQLRQDEAAINAKYDRLILQETAKFNTELAKRDLAALQDRADAEFAIIDRNERQKTIFRLQQEEERLRTILEINKTAVEKMTQDEVAAIMSQIALLKKQRQTLGYNNLYELLGINLDSTQQGALNTAIGSVKDSISSLVDSWNSVAEAAVNAAKAQVEAAQQALDAQIEARNAGYANEVETAQKELELAKKNQDRAMRESEKAQRAQLAIDTITQTSSLITATANIWKSLSGIPGFGTALALSAIATMWGSFAAAKIRAAQVTQTSEQYGEGTVELLQGGSHASGHDIDLGTKPDGTRRRAEGGEYFAVINKKNSRRFGHLIPDVINAFNDGTFADKYQKANAVMGNYAVGLVSGGKTDVSGLEKDVAAIRQQGDRTQYVDGDGNTVIIYKNLTRKIYKN